MRSFPAVLLAAGFLFSSALTGCAEKNMGKSEGDGWTKVDTHAQGGAAPSAPLPHADAVNVTYYYLPG